jgi:hypothetical protein
MTQLHLTLFSLDGLIVKLIEIMVKKAFVFSVLGFVGKDMVHSGIQHAIIEIQFALFV